MGWQKRNWWKRLGAKQGVVLLWAVWKWGILDCRGGGNLLVVSTKASKGIIAFCLEEFWPPSPQKSNKVNLKEASAKIVASILSVGSN